MNLRHYWSDRTYSRIREGLWALTLVTLPITSFPLVSRVSGGSQVSPFLFIPIFVLLVFWTVPQLVRTKVLPAVTAPLLLFVCVAVIATAGALFLNIHSTSDHIVLNRGIRALVTLVAGVAIYLVFATFPTDEKIFRRSLLWLYIGAMLTLAWGSIQAYFLLRHLAYPSIIVKLHSLISIRTLHYRRVMGLAYEPSWLSNQLVIVYIPLWAASVAKGFTVFGKRLGFLSVELGLIFWGLVIHFLTISRIGLISVFAILGVLVLWGIERLIDRWSEQAYSRLKSRGKGELRVSRFVLRLVLWAALFLILSVALALTVLLGSKLDPRIARMFETNYLEILTGSDQPVLELARKFEFGERVIYWMSGWRIFGMHPLLGVGLGVSGFFFSATVPAIGYRMPEIIRFLSGPPEMPNVKNLWLRLLAETGVVGFLTFVVWLIVLVLGARLLLRKGKGIIGVIGFAALLALVAQVWEGFSIDSFALPQLWLMPGLLTAALTIHFRRGREGRPSP